jgi:Heterokaryon incompatibility protein (HET)
LLARLVTSRFFLSLLTYVKGESRHWQAFGEGMQVPKITPDGLHFVHDWIQRCVSSHKDCRRPLSSKLPKRVVDVGTKENGWKIKVYKSQGKEGQYLCLSHCWGHAQPLKSTKDTLAKLMENIEWHEIPRTFQQAIYVTRQLGFRYLWIDSLCILQGDQDDWEEQSALMADIYGDAVLVIAATISQSSQFGFLAAVDEDTLKTFDIDAILSDGSKTTVHVRRSLCHGHDWVFPLEERGWTFQEELLASRVLYFYHDEIAFQCESDAWCCCSKTTSLQRNKATFATELTMPNYSTKTWHEVVSSFTERKLSFEQDKLPALSGIAKRFQRAYKMTYLAGLWGQQLIDDLCWYTDRQLGRRRQLATYRAPSWSWASVEAPIQFTQPCEFSNLDANGNLKDTMILGNLMDQSRILEAKCTSASKDPTGSVSCGTITIFGYMATATYRYRLEAWGPYFGEKGTLVEPFNADFSKTFSSPATIPQGGDPIYFLRLGLLDWPPEPPSKFRALVLKNSKDHAGDFERIGLIISSDHDSNEWFEGVEESIVTVW